MKDLVNICFDNDWQIRFESKIGIDDWLYWMFNMMIIERKVLFIILEREQLVRHLKVSFYLII